MSRLFIDIHLRQWPSDHPGVKLRDLDGNTVTLDGLVHEPPHQFILVELDADKAKDGIIDIPGHFTDYHPDNGGDNPRKPVPARLVERGPGNTLVNAKGEKVETDGQGRIVQNPGSADKPLGVQQ